MVKTLEHISSPANLTATARLEKFAASLNDLQKDGAPDSLLTADNTDVHPQSYYLDAAQNRILEDKEYFCDEANGKYFYKTDFRLDNPRDFKSLLSQNKNDTCLVVFTHEWLVSVRPRKNAIKWLFAWVKSRQIWANLEKLCVYANKNGYVFITDFNGVNYGR